MIYVDPLVTRRQYPKARMKRCRMTATSIPELHEFALSMGIPRAAFLYPPEYDFPHYEIGASQRVYAVEHGAVEVDCCLFEAVAKRCTKK